MKKLLYFMLLFIIITLTACGSKQYLVSFDSNGGEEIESVYVNLGQRAPAPKEITKEGHTLIGWFYGSEMWSFTNNHVTENITLTAKWQINDYTITFDTDGGSKVESITQENLCIYMHE